MVAITLTATEVDLLLQLLQQAIQVQDSDAAQPLYNRLAHAADGQDEFDIVEAEDPVHYRGRVYDFLDQRWRYTPWYPTETQAIIMGKTLANQHPGKYCYESTEYEVIKRDS